MAYGNGENVAESLKRPYPGNGEPEIAAEDASCGLEGGADVSEENLLKVQKEVLQLAEKVEEYRERGPVAFAHLLEKSLAQMRASLPSMDTHVNDKPTNAAAKIDGSLADQHDTEEHGFEKIFASIHEEDLFLKASCTDGMADEVASSEREVLEKRRKVLERLAAAKESLPAILRGITFCQNRLDKAIEARRRSLDKDSPLTPAPVE